MRAASATWYLVSLQMICARARLLIFLMVAAKLLDVLAHGGRWL